MENTDPNHCRDMENTLTQTTAQRYGKHFDLNELHIEIWKTLRPKPLHRDMENTLTQTTAQRYGKHFDPNHYT
jgi:hypothetical protein